MSEHAPNDLETLKRLLAGATSYAELAHQRLDRVDQQMAAAAVRLDRMEALQQQTDQKLDRLSDKVDLVAATVEALAQQTEQDRSQAALDREEFRSTVRDILSTLQGRFGGNGRT